MADPFELWRLMWSSAISRGLDSLSDAVPSDAALDRGRRTDSIDLSSLTTLKRIRIELPTMLVLERNAQVPSKAIPVIIVAPYAVHEASIADFADRHSLAQVIVKGGSESVALTYWKSATAEMRDYGIDAYLGDLNVAVDDLGGRASLIGLCQGGWLAAAYAARFPRKVARLVLAGAPIDTGAGDGPTKRMAKASPMSFYLELVELGGGVMKGKYMLQGWKNMHPGQHYFLDHIDLYEHVGDPVYLAKEETFDSWYENPIDLPGRWYLQAIEQLFKENRLAKGEFVGPGRTLDLRSITCPTYLLAGAADDITTPEQVLDAAKYIGTPKDRIVQKTVPGGHIGLFMGARTLKDHWPSIARWICAQ